MKCSLGISNFLEEISSLSHSLFSSICLHCSHSKVFLPLLAILWNSVFNWVYLSLSPLPLASLFFSAICKASSENHFAFYHFFFLGWSWSLPLVQCLKPPSIVLQGFCLSDLIPWIYLSLPLYNCKWFDLGHTWKWSSGFPYFLQFKSELGNKEFMIWATVSSPSCFCWLYRVSPSLAANNIINLISVLTIWWCPCVESSLALLEEGVCYDQCVLLAKLY